MTLVGYAFLPCAWWLHQHGKIRRCIAVLALCTGLLRFGPSMDPCLHEWDEQYHALVAKHLIAHPLTPTLYDDAVLPHGDGTWSNTRIWLNKPPLSLWAIALSLKTFGPEPWAVRIPSVLLSMVGVLILYALAAMLSDRRIAFWSALLFAVQGHLIELASGRTSNDHPDTFLVVFVLASIYAALRMAKDQTMRWALTFGVLTGLAFLSKSWPALIVVPVASAFLLRVQQSQRNRAMQCLIVGLLAAMLIALPWTWYTTTHFPEEAAITASAHWRHFTEGLEDHGRPWTYFWVQLPMINGELAPLALLWFFFLPFRKEPRKHAALLLWWLVPFIVFSFARTKMPGYTAISVPAICIILGSAIVEWSSLHSPTRTFRSMSRIGALALVLLPLRFSLDRTRPLEIVAPRYTIPQTLMNVPERTVVEYCSDPIAMMFHTSVAASYRDGLPSGAKVRYEALGYGFLRCAE